MSSMKGYDLIHDVVVKGMSLAAPLIRSELVARVLTSDGDVLDIVGVTYDEANGTIWLRAVLGE